MALNFSLQSGPLMHAFAYSASTLGRLGILHLIGALALSSPNASPDVFPDLSSWQPHSSSCSGQTLGVILTLLFLPHPTPIETF